MHTYQIAPKVLDNYVNEKLTEERMGFLKAQVDEQLEEMAQNKEIYDGFLSKINPPQQIDNIILWMLLMSNETICDEYIEEYGKSYREIIPVSDLADLLAYVIHRKKVQDIDTDGLDFLLEYDHAGKDEFDQYCFTNVLLFVEKSKQAPMEF